MKYNRSNIKALAKVMMSEDPVSRSRLSNAVILAISYNWGMVIITTAILLYVGITIGSDSMHHMMLIHPGHAH